MLSNTNVKSFCNGLQKEKDNFCAMYGYVPSSIEDENVLEYIFRDEARITTEEVEGKKINIFFSNTIFSLLGIVGPAATTIVGGEYVVFVNSIFEAMSEEVQVAIYGHELGHIVAGDCESDTSGLRCEIAADMYSVEYMNDLGYNGIEGNLSAIDAVIGMFGSYADIESRKERIEALR